MNKKQLISLLVIGINFICLSAGLAQYDLEVSGISYDEKGQAYAVVNGKVTKLAQYDLEVSGISYDEKGQSYAVVNDRVSKVGDIINKAKIIEIKKDSVRFENESGLFDIKIRERIKKYLQVKGSIKNWLSGSVQSIFKKVRNIFGAKQQRKEQEERVRKAEEERLAREEALRKRQEERARAAEEKRRAKEERVRKAEEERLAREEAERKEQEEKARKAEEERLAREEALRKRQEERIRKAEQEQLIIEEVRRLSDIARNPDYATKKEKNKILAFQYRYEAERLCRNSPEKAKELFLKAIECYRNVISYTVNIDEKLATENIIEQINKAILGCMNIRKTRNR